MNALWIDLKYVNLISSKLDKYKVKKSNPYLSNFRCPFCGDSQKNEYKARGYCYEKKGEVFFSCHNCSHSCYLSQLLKRLDFLLYEEYTKEIFITKNGTPSSGYTLTQKPDITKIERPKFLSGDSPLKQLKKISQLDWNHPAKQYIVNRKIPNIHHAKLFYAPKFAEWTNSIIPGKIAAVKDEPRLIIPFLKEDGTFFGYQGRSFNPKTKLRYITIMMEEYSKIYGLERIDKNGTVYVFEGPLDSLFIPNAIAMAGADVTLDKSFKNPVFVYDNEPRNKDIVKRIDFCIKNGYNIVVWDDTFPQKDINDMIMAGADAEHIKIIMDKRTFSGLTAKVELMKWKKCDY